MCGRLAVLREPDVVAQFVGVEAERFWPSNAKEGGHVVRLGNRAFNAEPLDGVASLTINHVDTAPSVNPALRELLLQRQTLKCLVMPCLG
jgi:hypothetical protein